MGAEDIVIPASQEQMNRWDSAGFEKYFNLPLGFSMDDEIRKATYTLQNITKPRINQLDKNFIVGLLKRADGLVFLTAARVGAVLTGQFGTGLVIAKVSDGKWSAPSALQMLGSGIGPQLGVDVTDYLLVLQDKDAIDAFSGTHQIAVGGTAGLTIGAGRHVAADLHVGRDRSIAVAYTWAHSKGWFAGTSIDGNYIKTANGINKKFYGKEVTAMELLTGKMPQPRAAQPLYEVLEEVLGRK